MTNPFRQIVLENSLLRVTLYPELGAKIGSIRALPDEAELLQQPLLPYAARNRTMAFDQGDASGYDECIPTVSDCKIASASGDEVLVPDHGDFWRLPFDVTEADTARVVMAATGFSLPLHFEKTVTLDRNRLVLGYRLTNIGQGPVEYLWSAHPGFAVEAGDRIELPSSVASVRVQWSAHHRLGGEGRLHPWPQTTAKDGETTDLSLVGSASAHIADKLFTEAPPEGWCAIERTGIGRRIEMRFDPLYASYLGIWFSYGGWPVDRPAQQYCVALEPCTAPTDSLADVMEQGLGRRLGPQASDQWQVEVVIT